MLRVLAFFLSLATAALAAEREQLITREVPWGTPLKLTEFGGPDIEVSVKAREITYVAATIADYTRMVPVARPFTQTYTLDDFGYPRVQTNNEVVWRPAVENRQVSKDDGVNYPGTQKEMYLLYHEPESGLRVYFYDVISRQNHDTLVIAVPAEPPSSASATPEHEVAAEPASTAPAAPRNASTLPPHVLSAELLSWYLRLQEARTTLELQDAAAVARFNEEVARYSAAVADAQARRRAR